MRSRSGAHARAVLMVLSAGWWISCGGGGGDITGPPVGALDLSTTTSGPEPDTDGYAVILDGAAPVPIAAAATRRIEGVTAGRHTVALSEVAANCTVAGGLAVSVEVAAGSVTTASFAVTCVPTTGLVQVTTSSTGDPADADGYTLLLDGVAAQPIGAVDTVTLSGVLVGAHTVGLDGVAANCTAAAGAVLSLTVAPATTAAVTINVTCSPPTPPPAPGSISVTTRTTGADADANGYAVTLDGGAGLPIDADGTLPLADLTAGVHTVGLTDVSANCEVAGENPRNVTVSAGTVASVTFDVTCATLPPSSGTLEVTTVTSGPTPDPDGYEFSIDGGSGQVIGVNATTSIAGLATGSHSVHLRGAAANCSIADNPRTVSVPAGATAQVSFTVACAAATGALQVVTTTSGVPADPDGYTVSLDGGAARALGTAATTTFDALAPGDHSLLLAGLALNCRVQDANPRTATVPAGGAASVTFAVECAATTGALAVTITGLPAGTGAAVSVAGPGGFTQAVSATSTLADLAPGAYTVTGAGVTNGSTTYVATPASATVAVSAGETAAATVTYGPAAGPTLNLRIDDVQLTQSVQSAAGDVPLVANRDGFLRVFVVADGDNRATPAVRIRLFRNGGVVQTFSIAAPRASTPTARDEGSLASTWNVKIPRALFTPDLAVLADVDPANLIAEKNEADNSFPASGTPQAQQVTGVPALGVLFVPVRQQADGLQGDVSLANKATYLDLTRRIYPIAGADGDLHPVYTTTTSSGLQPDDANGAWVTILGELEALRVAEGTSRNYYGVVRIGYLSGIAGLGYIGWPTAMGYDRPDDRSRVMAHELGHNFGRRHTPCGQPATVDPNYPYPGGLIGVYGYDLQENVLRDPLLPDIMGYCANPWISDYTYEGVLAGRAAQSATAVAAAATPERCLLVWGRIVDGRPVLEPAFEIVTRPSLPRTGGPYSLEGLAEDGSRLFALSFDAAPVADGRDAARQFAFAVPLGGASNTASSLRLAGPSGAVAAIRTAAADRQVNGAPAAAVEAKGAGGRVTLRWDALAYPMLLVRSSRTGDILSFARGGRAEIATNEAALDVVASDRVGSRAVRVTVAR